MFYHATKLGDTLVYTSAIDDGNAEEHTLVVRKNEVKDGAITVELYTEANGRSVPYLDLEVSSKDLKRITLITTNRQPPGFWLKLSAKCGETWEEEWKIGGQVGKMTYTMGKVEAIEVPAGKYQALRVDSESSGLELQVKRQISANALSFTPLYDGFNTNSLSREGIKVFNPPETSIAIEGLMWEQYKVANPGNDHEQYENWRAQQYEDYSVNGGFRVPGVTYE